MSCPEVISQCLEGLGAPATVAWIHALAAIILPVALFSIGAERERRRARAAQRATARILIARLQIFGQVASSCVDILGRHDDTALENGVMMGLYEMPRFEMPHQGETPPALITEIANLGSAVEMYAANENRVRRLAEDRTRNGAPRGSSTFREGLRTVLSVWSDEVAKLSVQILRRIAIIYPDLAEDAGDALGNVSWPTRGDEQTANS